MATVGLRLAQGREGAARLATIVAGGSMPRRGMTNERTPRADDPIPGYRGDIDDVRLLPSGEGSLPAGPQFRTMAEHALGYLTRNPVPAREYQSRFSFFLLNCPPFLPQSAASPTLLDPIAVGDTESRNDIAFNQMREMTGSSLGLEAQEAVHRRLVGYLRADNLCWAVPFCMSPDCDGPWAMIWTTAKLLQSEAALYRTTRDAEHRERARRIAGGLRGVASWETGRAFFPGGVAPIRAGAVARGYEGHYPTVIGPLLDYGTVCADPSALTLAEAIAEGWLSDLQPGHRHKPDGRVEGHDHMLMHAIRGVAQLGAMTANWRALDWAKAVYDHFHANSFDTGWLPEIVCIPGNTDHSNHSETCLVADMLEVEVWLALAGRPRYWDRVDRTIRNYVVPAQFSLTPAVEAFWCAVNRHRSPAEIEGGLRMLRELEGGFLSALTPNDRVFAVHPGGSHFGAVGFDERQLVLDMMGCCPPEGMRALYLAWANTVQMSAQGVLVNLALDHEGPHATVRTEMPRGGRLQATPKVDADFLLRPPSWTPRGQVQAWRNGREVAPLWGGPAYDYLRFLGARPGELLEITWPLVEFTQRVSYRPAYAEQADPYVYRWVGSTVVAVEPRGRWLPLWGGAEDGAARNGPV